MGGDDYLYGGGGADYLSGGDGTDTAYMAQTLLDTLDSIEVLLYKKKSGGYAHIEVVLSGVRYLQPDVIFALEDVIYDLYLRTDTIMALDIQGLHSIGSADFMVLPAGYSSNVQYTNCLKPTCPVRCRRATSTCAACT